MPVARHRLSWLVFGLGVVFVVKSAANVWRLSKSGQRLKTTQQELANLQAEQDRLTKRLQEVSSPEFAEREAKEKLGLGKPGEVIVILPQKEQESVRVEEQEKKVANWKLWWDKWVGI